MSTATAFFEAWTTGDLDTALSHVAPDVVVHGPAGQVQGAAPFREFVGNFAARLTGIRLLKIVEDEEGAVLFYETATDASPSALAAEYLTIENSLITVARYAFDRLPFAQAAAAQAQRADEQG